MYYCTYSIYMCLLRSLEKGNLLNWEEAPLELVNMTERRVSVDSICKPVRPGHVIFPLRRNFTSHLAICRKMRGLPSVVRDQRTQVCAETYLLL